MKTRYEIIKVDSALWEVWVDGFFYGQYSRCREARAVVKELRRHHMAIDALNNLKVEFERIFPSEEKGEK